MSAINKINVDNVSYNIEDSRVDNIADSIPTASTEQKGLVQVGQGINVDENGVISVEASGGDSVSYTDMSAGMDTATIGRININGTDYNINAPRANYATSVGAETDHIILGYVNNGAGSEQAVIAPAVSYEDYAQGTNALGIINVGGNQYPITYTPAASGDSVQFNSLLASGTQIGTITINGVETAIYAPAGGSGGGSSVSYRDNTSPEDQHRVVIGELTIDGAGYYIYAPSTISVEWDNIINKPDIPAVIGDVSGLAVTPDLSSGTKIASITWTDDSGENIQDIYAPAGGGSSVEPHFECDIAYDDLSNAFVVNNLEYVGPAVSEQSLIDWIGNTNVQTALRNLAVIKYQNQSAEECQASGVCRIRDNNTLIIDLPQPLYLPMGESGTTYKLGMIFSQINWTEIVTDEWDVSFEASCMTGTSFAKVNPVLEAGTPIAYINVESEEDGTPVTLYAPNPGDTVTVTQTLTSGTKIGEIDVNGTATELFAPAGGSGGDTVTVTPTVYSGTKIADINVSGNTTNLYAPNSVTSMNITPDLSSGTKIATIAWTDSTTNNSMDIYAPAGGSGGTVDWANVQNKPAIQPGTRGSGVYQQATNAIQQSGNTANGDYSIAIGYDTKATNHCAVAVGGSTQASGMWSVATGDGTIASSDRQVAMGKYNSEDGNNYFAVMVGNGSYVDSVTPPNRENAEATAWNGNKYIAGDLYVNCTDWDTTTTGGQAKLVTADAGGIRVATMNDIAGLGGDIVTVAQTVTSGTKIAEIDVSGTTTSLYAPTSAADNITQDEITAWNNAVDYEEQQSVKFTSSEEFSITIAINGHPWNGELWYSDDNGNIWHPIDKTRASITITSQSGDITNNQHQLMLRGTDNTFITGNETTVSSGWNTFSLTATRGVYGSGNIMALLDYRTANTNKVITRGRAFFGMFRSWTLLHTAPALPATTLSEACYAYMFTDDNVLEVAPELPATKLVTDCYQYMFSGCVSLREAPALPATKLAQACYRKMFYGCSRLVKVPKLPATTLATNCYVQMFANCTALKVPPELPATELATGCYDNMFYGCSSLIAIPILKATQLPDACYRQMFYGCNNITIQDSSSSEASIAYRIPAGTAAGTSGANSLSQMFSPMYSGDITLHITYYVSGVVRSDVTYDDYAYKPGDCVYYIEPITYVRDRVQPATTSERPVPVTQLAVSRALEAYRADWNAGSGQGTILNKPSIAAGSGIAAIKEGNNTTAAGNCSHAEGNNTTAAGNCSHTEGYQTQANANYSHAEGQNTHADGGWSHAEGMDTTVSGTWAHAEGYGTIADGNCSHSEGVYTKASSSQQHAQGKYNVEDANKVFLDIIGNGTDDNARSNAEATDWNGNKYLSGGIYVGCTDYTTTANGLTTLGAGGFRIDQAPESFDPTVDEDRTDEMVMVDSISYTGTPADYDPETQEEITPASYTAEHTRSWKPLPKIQNGLKSFEVEVGLNTGNYVGAFNTAGINGIWQLQAVISQIQDPNDSTQLIPDVDNPRFMWKFVSADTSAWDDTPETPEEPDPENPEEEPTE